MILRLRDGWKLSMMRSRNCFGRRSGWTRIRFGGRVRNAISRFKVRFSPNLCARCLNPTLDPDGYFRLGPIPEGTPVSLLANVDPQADPAELLDLGVKIQKSLLKIKFEKLDSAAARELLNTEVAPLLFKASKCPDLIEDSGHYFGTDLSDADKRALIEFLKTL